MTNPFDRDECAVCGHDIAQHTAGAECIVGSCRCKRFREIKEGPDFEKPPRRALGDPGIRRDAVEPKTSVPIDKTFESAMTAMAAMCEAFAIISDEESGEAAPMFRKASMHFRDAGGLL